MEIRIYFEGNKTLRTGFRQFFRGLEAAARQARSTIEFIAAKDGVSGYRKAIRSHPTSWNLLLKDSEQPMPLSPVQLCERLGIDSARVNDVFWMVELMESWFLADPEALAAYYGQGFSTSAIGATQDVEQIPKAEVLNRLRQAISNTKKRKYDKIGHAPHLLERLSAGRVKERARHCRTLFETISRRLERPAD
ncbi:MAG: DUF4276 family protein [Acidobacteriia bacterium]|nr:DUF4276 family protein [Terriglobia bacterium]